MKFKHAASFLLCIIFALFCTGCVTTNVHKFRMTASEAPEVHGANTQQASHSSLWRFTGKINYNAEKNANITKDVSEAPDLDRLFDVPIKFKDASYKMGGLDFSGKGDFLYKASNFVVGGGLGYKDGFFSHLTVGANYSHFEFGAFIGGYNQRIDIEYSGEKDDDSFDSHGHDFSTSLFAGLYAGFYLEKFFTNLSVSTYSPSPQIEGIDLDVPSITTAYLTIGYRLNRWLEFSVGGIATFIDTSEGNSYPGVTGGVSIYL